jgi:cytochrome c oxidase cbb3-type subunit 2
VVSVFLLSSVPSAWAVTEKPAPDLAEGARLFEENCARCHGVGGAADGRDANKMLPLPRVLTDGVYKFRTTASGSVPTNDDLYKTISEGLPGSRMPNFDKLPEESRWQLVYYIQSLAPSAFTADQKPEVLNIGRDPGAFKANLPKGKELYTQLGCNACHGAAGRADGPSAATLVDQWNQPIRSADLVYGWNFRGGSEPRDIVTRLMTGIDGTPMPSYADAVSPEDAWHLAYYVHSLQIQPNWSRALTVTAVDALPDSAEDPLWQKTERTDLRMASNYYQNGALVPARVIAVSAQALHDGTTLLLRLNWHDLNETKEGTPDAIAVALMADARAKWVSGSLRGWPSSGSPELDLIYWAAGWPEAKEGSGLSLTAPEKWSGSRPASATYADGEWTLLIRRPLQPDFEKGVSLAKEGRVGIGLMAWEGSNNEQGRHRSNSSWIDLVFN